MDLRLAHLRSLAAVVEQGHFGRAAVILGLSQPQVSRHVRALEHELGLVLVDRTSRRTQLTSAGRAVLPAVLDALAAAERVRFTADAAARSVSGGVAVGFIWSTLPAYLGPLLATVSDRHPEIDLSVRQLRWLEILTALRHGSVDLVIARTMHEPSEMVAEPIAIEPTVLVLASGHRLAGRDRVTVDELRGEPIIALRRSLGPAAYDAMLAAQRSRGLESRIVQHAVSPQEAVALAGAGLGVYRLPASAAAPRPGISLVELVDAPSRVWLLRRPEPPAAALVSVIACAREIAPGSPAAIAAM
jgi:DNA-binding transcriptional LysR family regulator